jgi:hypothetical protein
VHQANDGEPGEHEDGAGEGERGAVADLVGMSATMPPPPIMARTTIGLRPQRSAMAPQTGAISARTMAAPDDMAPAQRATAAGSVTPSRCTYRGRNGMAMLKASMAMACERQIVMKVRRQGTPGAAWWGAPAARSGAPAWTVGGSAGSPHARWTAMTWPKDSRPVPSHEDR